MINSSLGFLGPCPAHRERDAGEGGRDIAVVQGGGDGVGLMLQSFAVVFLLLISFSTSFASSLLQTTTPQQCAVASSKDAEKGNVNAQTLLAYCYSLTGLPEDLKDAFYWYSEAAKAGDPIAQNNLATMLLVGRPYKKNEPLAAQWYMQAAMQGNARAQYNLATLYRQGTGVEKNYAMALKWYKEAAYQNDAFAMDALAFMHEKGLGMAAPDEEKARYWRRHSKLAKNQKFSNPWKE